MAKNKSKNKNTTPSPNGHATPLPPPPLSEGAASKIAAKLANEVESARKLVAGAQNVLENEQTALVEAQEYLEEQKGIVKGAQGWPTQAQTTLDAAQELKAEFDRMAAKMELLETYAGGRKKEAAKGRRGKWEGAIFDGEVDDTIESLYSEE